MINFFKRIYRFLKIDNIIAKFLQTITGGGIKSNKLDGISICVRINKDAYVDILYDQIVKISAHVDEILIHFNSLENEQYFINKFKTITNCFLKKYSKHNFNMTTYTNDFIDEMRYKWFMNFDADIIFNVEELLEFFKKVRNSKQNTIYFLSGANILKDSENKVGFSDCSNDSAHIVEEHNYRFNFTSFVGLGDFVCYVPQYTNTKKRYWLRNNKHSNFHFNFYDKKFTGLLFIHLSWINLPIKKVYNELNFEIIEKNINNSKNIDANKYEYIKYCFKNIMKSTTQDMLNNIYDLKSNYLKSIDITKFIKSI